MIAIQAGLRPSVLVIGLAVVTITSQATADEPTLLGTAITPSIATEPATLEQSALEDSAKAKDSDTVIKDQLIEEAKPTSAKVSMAKETTVNQPKRTEEKTAVSGHNKYDIEQLQADPLLFDKTLNQAISAKDWQSVVQLLPYYRALASSDPTLIKFAQASIEQSQNKFKPIISLYQAQLLDKPEDYKVRLSLALALQADKQFTEAKAQLLLLQGVAVPKAISTKAERALASINKIEAWRFNVSTNLVIDPNINDAPPKYIQDRYGKVIEQEVGSDVSVSASANKRINLPKRYYATVGSNVFLDGFWKDDDEINYLLTGSVGIGYNDPKNEWALTPSITKRIYDDTSYSQRQALNLRGSRWLGKKLRMNANTTWSTETFDRDLTDRRKTDSRYLGVSGLYVQDAQESLVATIGHQETELPNSVSSSSEYNTLSIGWNKQWENNFATAVTVSYMVKDYADPALRYGDGSLTEAQAATLTRYYNSVGGEFGRLRQDRTSGLALQVWKRDFTFYGVTPRLNLKYNKTVSNFDYYDDRKDKAAIIQLSKNF